MRPLSAIADDDPITHRGIVYFIGSGDAIKIGYSTDLQKRIADLKTGAAADIEATAQPLRKINDLES